MSGATVTVVLLLIRSRNWGTDTTRLLRSWPSYITLCRKKGYKYEETHGSSDPVMSAVSVAGNASSTVAYSVPGTGCRREDTLDDLVLQPRVVPRGCGYERSLEDTTLVTGDDEGPCGEERDDARYGHAFPEGVLPRSWRAGMQFIPCVPQPECGATLACCMDGMTVEAHGRCWAIAQDMQGRVAQ